MLTLGTNGAPQGAEATPAFLTSLGQARNTHGYMGPHKQLHSLVAFYVASRLHSVGTESFRATALCLLRHGDRYQAHGRRWTRGS